MAKYIEEKELREWVENWFEKNRYYHPYSKTNDIPIPELYDILEQMPTADVSERNVGKWIVDEKRFGNAEHHCNLCGAILEGDEWKWRNNYFCYYCGAEMDGVKNE